MYIVPDSGELGNEVRDSGKNSPNSRFFLRNAACFSLIKFFLL